MDKLYNTIGWVTKEAAKKEGFTNHGSYYGIPLYIGGAEDDMCIVTKHIAFEWLVDIADFIESLCYDIVGAERMFCFTVGSEI